MNVVFVDMSQAPLPPRGFMNDLAKQLGVNRITVSRALRNQTYSKIANEIRQKYYELYVAPYLGDKK